MGILKPPRGTVVRHDGHYGPTGPESARRRGARAVGICGIIAPVSGTAGGPAPPAGWYADPSGTHAWRWWDGARWTGFTSHPQQTAPPPEPFDKRKFEAQPHALTRNSLVWETRWVLVAFLVPSVTAAVAILVQHAEGVTDINRFQTFVNGQPLTNMILGILVYLGIGAIVPITLLLLARTGQTPSVLGLGVPSWMLDVWPGLGLAAMSYGAEVVVLIPFAPFLAHHSGLVVHPAITSVPSYYIIYGIVVSAITAITEEVVVNGYLLVRLEQLGWAPGRALLLSLVLRSSYHIYYGIAVVFVVPFGYFVTRSFQKHRRLNRPIMAHFIYDAVLITISVLTS